MFVANGLAGAGERPDLPHFFEVEPGIYRGAQPRERDFAELKKMGVATVLSLRSTGEGVEKERKIVEGLGMRFVNVPLRGYQTPSHENIDLAVAELEAAKKTGKPVFVHCKLGKDRTGTVVACYRMKTASWKADQALAEAKSKGMSRRQWKMQKYVLAYPDRAPAVAAAGATDAATAATADAR